MNKVKSGSPVTEVLSRLCHIAKIYRLIENQFIEKIKDFSD